MKCLLLAALVVLVVVEVTAPFPPLLSRGKKCSTSEDCDDDECCIGGYFGKGRCRELGAEGKKNPIYTKLVYSFACSLENDLSDGKYSHSCPCEEGLVCHPEKSKKYPWGQMLINLRCIHPSSTTAEPEVETEALEPEAEG
ncbi:hypothetical protein TNIN_284361 [Trichonephila inaurata madagascariensis]|uniref:Prokineticin domain-containing protein n=1 Tax=Trichonephila inaurata madagascariensis TaxID=2747483 RepID=A0A8X6YH26_9ARAC|nr:hypothetical protein TNIN_284361 [Trichonephila inaurata madagascariensis]